MRMVWIFILFGSLITYHCFSPVSSEVEAAKPSYRECKQYVDAALKGEQEENTLEWKDPGDSDEENDATDAGSSEDEAEALDDPETTEDIENQPSEDQPEENSTEEKENQEEEEDGPSVESDIEESEKQESEQRNSETKEENQEEGVEENDTNEEQEDEGETPEQDPEEFREDESDDENRNDEGADNDNVADDTNESNDPEEEKQESADQSEEEESTETYDELVENQPKEDTEEESSDSNDNGESTEEVPQEEEKPEEIDYAPRPRDHMNFILGLDGSTKTENTFKLLEKTTQSTLKELKSIYESAIKPLEMMYKYRDLSNRHFGDPEIFSKPLVLLMGPWSGGKSTIINWLLDIEHQVNALRTGADPSPALFNIIAHGKEEEVLDGTQLAADWTFSGLQKFGQNFLDRLKGRRLPNKLLEMVNIVEIPGILEVRKQVERSFPFNDACQWFIDRADIIFLVYDPAKLDIGPETEAILDQLKGRENQIRIILNKADMVKSEELLRVQATLVWNISPLMSSAEPPTMYAVSLWDKPLQPNSPIGLLVSHENNFLNDIRMAIEKRVETRIAATRRFAVRVRNHGKMVDCYLNTFNNHKSFFSDKKKITKDIIEHPQNYHIYEGLSTLRNISRYDLPDPDTYRDFFKLHSLWDFPTLSSTCSYFRGCPINKLDVAIAYELPDLLGKFRRQRESIAFASEQTDQTGSSDSKKG